MRSKETQKELAINRIDTKGSNPKYRLNSDEAEIIHNYRRIISEAEENGLDPATVKAGWIKNDNSSLYFRNPNFQNALVNQKEFEEKLMDSFKGKAKKYKPIKRNENKNGHLLIIDPADVHVGKLCSAFETGKDYNTQIAVQRCLEGVYGILEKSKGFNIDKIVFIGGNDILHVDNARNTTTSGTYQDASGMWYDNFLMAKQLYVDILETLLNHADVDFIFNASNHDYTNGFFLAQVIEAHFSKCENIKFQNSINHRKYFTYGNSLIGSTHGDGAKNNDLGMLMSVEAKEHWADSEYRYFYTHHVHHKTSKDLISCTIESLRSPSPADSWHHRNGYINQPAIEGFIHSKTKGQIARLTHYL